MDERGETFELAAPTLCVVQKDFSKQRVPSNELQKFTGIYTVDVLLQVPVEQVLF